MFVCDSPTLIKSPIATLITLAFHVIMNIAPLPYMKLNTRLRNITLRLFVIIFISVSVLVVEPLIVFIVVIWSVNSVCIVCVWFIVNIVVYPVVSPRKIIRNVSNTFQWFLNSIFLYFLSCFSSSFSSCFSSSTVKGSSAIVVRNIITMLALFGNIIIDK